MNKDKYNINLNNLNNILEKLFSLHRFGIKPGLERILAILEKNGNPETKFKSVHISGTNGKGSVSAMLASILLEAGYKVGLYTSPHLVKFNERIQINGKMISDDDLVRLASKYLPESETVDATFFEITTAIAFEYFAENDVDVAIIETGMGGRYDATNVLMPILSVITAISKDHSEYLGDSIEQIAEEKAGIIKKKVQVVAFDNGDIINSVIKKKAKKESAPLVFSSDNPLPKIVKYTHTFNRVVEVEFAGETFTTHFKLAGKHQIENLRLVVGAAEKLRKVFTINAPDVESGIEYVKDNLFFRGRSEVINKKPLTVLDGAHNIASISSLKETILNSKYKSNKFNILFAAMQDKDIREMIEELEPIADSFIFTTPKTERAAKRDLFEKIAKERKLKYTYYEDVVDAYIYANKLRQPLIITGSFYLAGEVLNYLEY